MLPFVLVCVCVCGEEERWAKGNQKKIVLRHFLSSTSSRNLSLSVSWLSYLICGSNFLVSKIKKVLLVPKPRVPQIRSIEPRLAGSDCCSSSARCRSSWHQQCVSNRSAIRTRDDVQRSGFFFLKCFVWFGFSLWF